MYSYSCCVTVLFPGHAMICPSFCSSEIFKSVMQWIKHKKEERMEVAAKIIGAVRLGLVNIREVIAELNTQEMRVIPEIHTLLHESLLYSYEPSASSEFATNKTKPRSMKSVRKPLVYLSRSQERSQAG